MKQQYENPEITIMNFEVADVITTSALPEGPSAGIGGLPPVP